MPFGISRRSSCQKCSVNCKKTIFSSLEYATSPHSPSLLDRRRAVLLHSWKQAETNPGVLGGSALSGGLRPSPLHLWPKPQTERCASCLPAPRVSLLCFSMGRAFFLWLWSVHPAALCWTSFTNLLLNVDQKLIVRKRSLCAVFNQMLKKFCFGRTLISERQKTAFT